MSQLIDLDAASVPDIRFKLNGKEYRVPGELEVEQMLRWIKIQDGWGKLAVRSQLVRDAVDSGDELPDDLPEVDFEPEDLIRDSKEEVLKLFRIYQPTLKDLPFKSSQIGTVFGKLLGRYQEDEEPDPTPPTPKPARKRRS